MLDKNKIQIEILKALLKGENVYKVNLSDNLMITINGHYAYVVDEKIFLNLSLLQEMHIDMQLGTKPLIDTRLSVHTDSCIMRKLKFEGEEKYVYVNEKVYKNFKDCKMFGDGENTPIYCYNDMGEPFGIMMPIRNRDDCKEAEQC